MPSQLNFNVLRALDANSVGLPGALAYFYETGTSTPLTVYTDSGLGTPHPSPLVADAEGVFAPVFTDGATAVKVDVTTAAAATVNGFPIDPVQLISSTGSAASAVTFSPVTGNSATNVQAAIENLTTANNTALDLGATSPYASAAQGTLADDALPLASVLDEDDMVSNSNTLPVSQQSLVAYIAALPGAIVAVLEDQKTSGTAAASITANTWTARELNTEVRDTGSYITLSSNQFTSTVNGWVEWSAPGTDTFSTRLYNVTDTVEVAKGQSLVLGAAYYATSSGGAAIVAGKTYEIQQNQSVTRVAGAAASDGTEVYTRVKIYSA